MLLIDLHVGFTIYVVKDMDPLLLKNAMVLAVEQRPRMSVRARSYKFLTPSSARLACSSPSTVLMTAQRGERRLREDRKNYV